ncbi:MAG: uracil-DNA glycosylase [Deinococcales bacterium]
MPGFGDPDATVLLLGLAPGAHGSNRTGRMFTGDASGAFLFPALHRAGLASRRDGSEADDGMTLHGVWITAALRCVPPGNKPRRDELANCRRWLQHDLAQLPRLRAVVALGRIAHDSYLDLLRAGGTSVVKAHHLFAHGAEHRLEGGLPLLDAYHVSFQNTNTGRLTPAMFDAVLARAKELGGR